MSDALQDEIAFQVSVKVVYEFEPVQIHQHQCKGAARACRAFPFGRERLHEEAVGLDSGQAVRDGLFLRFLERQGVMQGSGDQVRQSPQEQHFFVGKVHRLGRFHVQHAVQLFAIENGKGNRRAGIRQNGLQSRIRGRGRPEGGHVSGPRDLAHDSAAERHSLAQRAPSLARFRLDDDLSRRILQLPDADVVVRKSFLELLRDFREHLVGIQGRNRVARNVVQQREMARFRAFLVEKPRVLDGNAGFAGQDAQQLEMSFIEGAVGVREDGHRANRVVVSHQRNSAEAASRPRRLYPKLLHFFGVMLPNQDRLPRPYDVFGDVIAHGLRPLRHEHSVDHFEVKSEFVANRVKRSDIKILHVEEPPQLLPNLPQQIFLVQGGAERATDFVQHMQLFRAARSLLNQIAVLDGHPDLVAQSEQQPQFGRSKPPAVRRAEQQHAKRLLLGLQADGNHASQSLPQRQFAKSPYGLIFFKRGQRIVSQIAETQQSAEARHQPHQVVIEAFLLRGAAEFVAQSDRHHGSRPLGIAVVQKKSPRRQAHHAQDSIQRLRQHPLDLSSHKTRSRQIQIGERQHVALDAALLLFVKRHHHEHGHKGGGGRADRPSAQFQRSRVVPQSVVKAEAQDGPHEKRNRQEAICESFLAAAFLPEDRSHRHENQG